MAYRPSPLETTERALSMSASLEASTATPAITAPEVSFTWPEIVLCAEARARNKRTTLKAAPSRTANLARIIPISCGHGITARSHGPENGRDYMSPARRCQGPGRLLTEPPRLTHPRGPRYHTANITTAQSTLREVIQHAIEAPGSLRFGNRSRRERRGSVGASFVCGR